ncbi:MAG: hypothetical protein NVSMB42_26700 [Herpetosiphon sp.]
MTTLLAGLVIETILATYVVTHAWPRRPVRLFVLPVLALAIMNVGLLFRLDAQSINGARWAIAGEATGLLALDGALLLLLSDLFAPRWWEGRRPIRWIIVPYIAGLIAVVLDIALGWQLIAAAVTVRGKVYSAGVAIPGGVLMLLLYSMSWLPHVWILARAFVQRPSKRFLISLFGLPTVMGALAFPAFLAGLPLGDPRASLFQMVPLLLALAYAVFRDHLFEPTRAAMDLVIQSLSEAVVIVGPAGAIIFANPQALKLGLRTGLNLRAALAAVGATEGDIGRLLDAYDHTGLTNRATFVVGEPHRLLDVSITPVADPQGRVQGTLLLGRDVTDLERRTVLLEEERRRLAHAVQQLAYLASHDPLTGLPNRRSFFEALERVVARARRGQGHAVLFIDLDNFKSVNDTIGHGAGDTVLVTLAHVLEHEVREVDMLSRLGGDEFAVLLEGSSVEQACRIAERMRLATLAHPWRLEGQSFALSLSIGVVYVDGEEDANALLAKADIAMYDAKNKGRNQVIVYQRPANVKRVQ